LNEQIQLLSKKHGQLKQAITKMVQVSMEFIDDTPSVETKLSLIETLRTVTEGKIFVEVERARVTRILSNIKKSQGDITAATDILCELQVETFGSMTRREKTEFILEQVSLCITKGDWTQASILSRKIGTRYFARKPKKSAEQLEKEQKEREEEEKKRGPDDAPVEPEDDVTDLKLRYYEQQITLAKHDDKYLDACKHYRQVLDTEAVENNPEQLRGVSISLRLFTVRVHELTFPRLCNASSTLSSSPLTTTNNQISFTESTAILATHKFHKTPPSSISLPSLNLCAGPLLPKTTVLTSARPIYSMLPRTRTIPRLTSAGKICASVSLSTTSESLPSTTPEFTSSA
jgi:hypothetical protein